MNRTMKNTLAIIALAILGILTYAFAAYTRPHEPAGRILHGWLNGYQPRPTLRPLEVVSPAAAGYTPAELDEIYPSH